MKFKAIAAAAALTVLSGSAAAYTLPNTGNSSVIMSVYDEVVGVGITFDLGFDYLDVINSGGSIFSTLTGNNYDFGTTFATSVASDINWNITAGSNPGGAANDFLMFSSTQTAPETNNIALQSALSAMDNYFNATATSNIGTGNPGTGWQESFNGTAPTINNATGLGGTMDMFVLTTTSFTQIDPFTGLETTTYPAGSASTPSQFYDLNIGLSANGDFTVASAVVPLPAAVWLFGAGLMGLVGVARRRAAA